LADLIRDPDAVMDHVSSRVMKDGPKTKVVQREFHNGAGSKVSVIAKRFRYGRGLRRLGFFIFPSPAMRCLKAAGLLQSKGILTPAPLAALEYRNWKNLGTSYYLSEEVSDGCSLQFFWQSVLATLPDKRRLAVRRSLLRDLARLLSRLHSLGIYHRDLKTSNILLQEREGVERRIFLIDLDRVEERGRLPLAKRVKNLLQIRRRAWASRDKMYFFMRYAEGLSGSRKKRNALVREILALSRRSDNLR
jgi:serine/threonine protein kinase